MLSKSVKNIEKKTKFKSQYWRIDNVMSLFIIVKFGCTNNIFADFNITKARTRYFFKTSLIQSVWSHFLGQKFAVCLKIIDMFLDKLIASLAKSQNYISYVDC